MNNIESDLNKRIVEHLKRKELSTIFELFAQNKNISLNDIKITNKTDILLESIISQQIVFIEKILDNEFDLNDSEFLYLHHAIRSKNNRMINLLLKKIKKKNLEYIAYFNKTDKLTNNNALHVAIDYKLPKNILLSLSEHDVSWNSKNNLGITPGYSLFFDKEYLKSVLSYDLIDSFFTKALDFNIKCNGVSILDIINQFRDFEDLESNEEFQYLISKF